MGKEVTAMKRALSVVLALAALVIALAPAAFASEAELSDIQRPVDAQITQSPPVLAAPSVGVLPGSQAVTEEQQITLEDFRSKENL
jgi:hypothetical protein